jgi:putative aldouronate transport system permease protein
MPLSAGEKWFAVFNYTLLSLFGFVTFAPFLNVVAQSFSDNLAIVAGEVGLWPSGFHWDAYIKILNQAEFIQAFNVTVGRTVVGSLFSVLLTALLAYPLSKAYIRGRSGVLFYVFFTMLFSGGMIPNFLVVKSLGLFNSFWVYILPGAISAFHVIILKNFFQSVPVEVEESAVMDGCSNLGILFRIVVPLSMPAIATIALFNAVHHWNSFFDAVLYVNNDRLYPLQIFLRNLIAANQTQTDGLQGTNVDEIINPESLKAAALITSMLPIIIAYPLLQKYFVKGITLGSIKS